jgi:hypothetical protein
VTTTIAYDVMLRRPGCAMLQAVLGCSVTPDALSRMLDAWLLHPTPDLKVYSVTEDELEQLISLTNEHERSNHA